MRTRVMPEPIRRRGAPGRIDLRRLRAGVFRLGGHLGLDIRAVVQFSETISGKRWKRCDTVDLERVAADLSQLKGWMARGQQLTDTHARPLTDRSRRSAR